MIPHRLRVPPAPRPRTPGLPLDAKPLPSFGIFQVEIHLGGPLWLHILHPVSGPGTPTPSSSVGSRTESPCLPPPPRSAGPSSSPGAAAEEGERPSGDPRAPLPGSRHIGDLSFSVVYCAEARPPRQIGAGPASRGPRRPSRPSPEQPPAHCPLSRPRAQQAPSSGGPDTLYGAQGPVSPIVCPCLQPRSCLPHDFIPGDAPVWTGPACRPAEASLSARALGPPSGFLIHHLPGASPACGGAGRAGSAGGGGAQLVSRVGTCRRAVPPGVSPDVRAHATVCAGVCIHGYACMCARASGVWGRWRASRCTHTHTHTQSPSRAYQLRPMEDRGPLGRASRPAVSFTGV